MNQVEAIRRTKEEISKFSRNNPYVDLLRGEPVLMSNMVKYAPVFIMGALRLLISEGRVVEQGMLFPEREGDSMLFKV